VKAHSLDATEARRRLVQLGFAATDADLLLTLAAGVTR